QGFWDGEISLTPSGVGGFGYDPIFYLPERQCTSAELSSEEKDSISHRAQALAKLKHFLEQHKNYL
ncbi:MAG TPA: non-canonical purine NTP pyrophosphatase, partial [Aeromonadales bacterium]|nr:non-canonical purine NTP pyrophosphatase [Aeromonadales bacterium]